MEKGKVTVLGSNGSLGHAAMRAFSDAGWVVQGLGRANREPVAGTQFIAGDAADLVVLKAAIADSDVVVNGLHLRYDRWGNGRAEAQLQVVIDALAGSGKTLLFPGTIYNYRASDRIVGPTLRQSAEAPRGEIRIRLETMLRKAAASKGFKVIILRAGDFYGPGQRGDWFEAGMLMDQRKGRLYHLDDLAKRHSWAYLPDLGRAFVRLAEQRAQMGSFTNHHFEGHWASHSEIMAAIGKVVPFKPTLAPMPWWLLRAVGLVNPVMRDIFRMRYLWINEMELVDPEMSALLGPGFGTPLDVAVGQTVRDLIGGEHAKAA